MPGPGADDARARRTLVGVGAKDREGQTEVLRRLAELERKLDVLIESQGLEGRLRDREADEEAAREARRREIAEQFRRSLPRPPERPA